MRISLRIVLMVLSVLSVSLLVQGCKTGNEVVHPYYSPFRESGALADWADIAIQQGIGQQVNPHMAPYPDNRIIDPNQRLSARKLEKENKALSERVAQMVGGWDHIGESSDQMFTTLQGLAMHLPKYSNEPRFAEALAATMMLYPALRAEYYPVTAGSHNKWGSGSNSKKKGKAPKAGSADSGPNL